MGRNRAGQDYDCSGALDILFVSNVLLAMSISHFRYKVERSALYFTVTLWYSSYVVKEYSSQDHMELITSTPQLEDEVCPVARTAQIISGKWTILIIRDLAVGVKRFNQLERSLHGISPKTLSERLRSLEEEGIIQRRTFAEVPPRVEYSLTEKGRDLVSVIESMRSYGKQWLCKSAHL
jgi:DNA-binding HxlR family transcriptional regulator